MTKDYTWALQIYLDDDKELDEQFRQEAVLALRTQDSFTVRAQLARAIEAEFKQQLKNGILPEHTQRACVDTLESVDWNEVAMRYLRAQTVSLVLTVEQLDRLADSLPSSPTHHLADIRALIQALRSPS